MCLCQIDIMDWSVDFLLTTTTTELQGSQKIQLNKYNQPTSTDTDEKVDQSQLEIVPPCISIGWIQGGWVLPGNYDIQLFQTYFYY